MSVVCYGDPSVEGASVCVQKPAGHWQGERLENQYESPHVLCPNVVF